MSQKPGLLPLSRQVSGHRRPISSFVKGGACLMVTACLDMSVAFSTGYWATWSNKESGQHGGFGLWKVWNCQTEQTSDEEGVVTREVVCEEKWADNTFPVWHITSQVMLSLGLIGLLVSFFMLVIYVFMPAYHRNKSIMSAIIGTSYTSGFFTLVALCVFGAKVVEGITVTNSDWFLSWSFSLACTSFVLSAISASILMTENNRLNHDDLLLTRAAVHRTIEGPKMSELKQILEHEEL